LNDNDYAAKRAAARLARALGQADRGPVLDRQADQLANRCVPMSEDNFRSTQEGGCTETECPFDH
jgi:hypothetical protein